MLVGFEFDATLEQLTLHWKLDPQYGTELYGMDGLKLVFERVSFLQVSPRSDALQGRKEVGLEDLSIVSREPEEFRYFIDIPQSGEYHFKFDFDVDISLEVEADVVRLLQLRRADAPVL